MFESLFTLEVVRTRKSIQLSFRENKVRIVFYLQFSRSQLI